MNLKVIIITKQFINSTANIMVWNPTEHKDLIGDIKNQQPDLLVTVDLLGFECCTLTDNISYNLLGCKQIHLLLHENLVNEKYLQKQLSIAMFFYCAGNRYYEYLRMKYPDLPFLGKIPKGQFKTLYDWEKFIRQTIPELD